MKLCFWCFKGKEEQQFFTFLINIIKPKISVSEIQKGIKRNYYKVVFISTKNFNLNLRLPGKIKNTGYSYLRIRNNIFYWFFALLDSDQDNFVNGLLSYKHISWLVLNAYYRSGWHNLSFY